MPPVRTFVLDGTHPLVPTKYRPEDVFREVVEGHDVEDFDNIVSATSLPRHQGATGGSGISQRELVYGIPNSGIVRNTFEFAGDGGRFMTEAAEPGMPATSWKRPLQRSPTAS